jgi:NhaA family Na+:H+ antiporter
VTEERIHHTWLHSDRAIPKRFVRPMLRFTRIEAAGGAVMLVAAAAALIWANSPVGDSYAEFWDTHFEFSLGPLHLEETLKGLVNDGLMAVFFFVVGLEIKRELVLGELRDPKAAGLPVMAALGGMIVPALIYVGFASGADAAEAGRGWGIPMATDIAFSLGVVSLLGTRVPVGAKLFLLTLAIADDIGAILVIAVFYAGDLAWTWLGLALAGLAFTAAGSRVGIRNMAFYGVMAILTWFCLLESGVHATLAGVALALITPARPMYGDHEFRDRAQRVLDRFDFDSAAPRARQRIDQDALVLSSIARESVPPLKRMEETLLPWSSFVVVPIFALANAGVSFAGIDIGEAVTHPVALGVAVGLLLGKTAGISAFAWVALRLGWGRLPQRTSFRHVVGLAAIAGIGFTVSLFVTGLAFEDPLLTDRAKIGIFVGSGTAGLLGYFILRSMGPRVPATTPSGTDRAQERPEADPQQPSSSPAGEH